MYEFSFLFSLWKTKENNTKERNFTEWSLVGMKLKKRFKYTQWGHQPRKMSWEQLTSEIYVVWPKAILSKKEKKGGGVGGC